MSNYHYNAIHQHRLMVSNAPEKSELQMTDYFFLFSFFCLMFWALDPLRVGMDMIGFVKRVPTGLLLTNLAFIAVSRLLYVKRSNYMTMGQALREQRWLVAFSAMVVAGSLYAKYKSGIDATFLTMGFYVMMAPIIYWYVVNSAAPMRLLRAILYVMLFWALIAAGLQFAYFRKLEAFHNREHLVLPILGVFFYFAKWRYGRLVALMLLPATAIAANKNTAFFLAVIVMVYLVGISLYRRLGTSKDSLLKITAALGTVVAIATSLAILAGLYLSFKRYMPTGNPEYRLHTYAMAWKKFTASPIWGNGFTKEAVEFFDRFEVATVTQNLPTHSDPLDIMANGGLIALGLWLMGILPKLWTGFFKVALHTRQLDWKDETVHQCFLLMSLMAVLVCIFNPIYNLPNLAFANWMLFGCMLASTRICTKLLQDKKGQP